MGFIEETHETLNEQYKMMSDLRIDYKSILTLIPFPSTPVFKQAFDEDLFVNGMDPKQMWKTPMNHAQKDFLIKPYKLSIKELEDWRGKLELLKCA
jgi:hypothetical protein